MSPVLIYFCFFNDTATSEIYTLSLHDALPILLVGSHAGVSIGEDGPSQMALEDLAMMRALTGSTVLYPSEDRKSTRLNSSHTVISYAVFCLKKKKKRKQETTLAIRHESDYHEQ